MQHSKAEFLSTPNIPFSSKNLSFLNLKSRQNVKTKEQSNLKSALGRFESEIYDKDLGDLQDMLEVKKKENEDLKNEIKEIENQIKMTEVEIKNYGKGKRNDPSVDTKKKQDVDLQLYEYKRKINEVNENLSSKTKNLKEYKIKLKKMKNEFKKLSVNQKKQLIIQLRQDTKLEKFIKTDDFLMSFFKDTETSLEF